MRIFTLAVMVPLFLSISLKSQIIINQNINELLNENYKTIDKLYQQKLSNQNKFINGKLYIPKGNKFDHPYFDTFEWQQTVIAFNNKADTIELSKFDIESGVLVFLKSNGNKAYPIQLEPTLINQFEINNHKFIYLKTVQKKGYYEEIIINHNAKIYIYWSKRSNYGNANTIEYKTLKQFFFRIDNSFYKISRIQNIYKIFSDKKNELKNYKKQNNLDFIQNKTSAITELVNYYHSLK